MKTLTSLTAMAVVLFAAAEPLQAGIVTIDSSNTVSAADDDNLYPGTSYDSETNTSTAIPTNTTISASVGGASSSTTIGYNEVGGQTIFGFDMSHARAGGNYSYGLTYESSLLFHRVGQHRLRPEWHVRPDGGWHCVVLRLPVRHYGKQPDVVPTTTRSRTAH